MASLALVKFAKFVPVSLQLAVPQFAAVVELEELPESEPLSLCQHYCFLVDFDRRACDESKIEMLLSSGDHEVGQRSKLTRSP